MFQLKDHYADITSFNPRAEKHGEENVMAGDLKFETVCHNSDLDHFDKGLRVMLFRKASKGEQQELGLEGGDELTARRLPNLAPLGWNDKYSGYKLTIQKGMGLSDDLVLDQCDLSRFRFEAMDGGSVRITFTASFHPGPGQAGQLCELIGDNVKITLTPPGSEEE